jgi:hypothetical protein
LHPGAHIGKSFGEFLVSGPEVRSTRHGAGTGGVAEPIAHHSNHDFRAVAIRLDILAGRKMGTYSSSNGQLINTLSRYGLPEKVIPDQAR